MEDPRRNQITAKALPLPGDDIDTDRIIPARFLRCVTFDALGPHAFEDDRIEARKQGTTHPFDAPQFQEARILLAGRNFGCGSSREHAPQALARWNQGIQVIIGLGFAQIFFGNCLSIGLPCLTTELEALDAMMEKARQNPLRWTWKN